jgi:hypothetical protein
MYGFVEWAYFGSKQKVTEVLVSETHVIKVSQHTSEPCGIYRCFCWQGRIYCLEIGLSRTHMR